MTLKNCSSFLRFWFMAIRPKTLVAAVAPVLMATILAFRVGSVEYPIAFLVLLTALLIQIATNVANDLIDFKRGTDIERVGPTRAAQSGLLSEIQLKKGLYFILAAVIFLGFILVLKGGWPILVIGLAAIVCTIWYSAGPLALSYTGLADFFVLIFFGPIATSGTFYLLTGQWWIEAFGLGFAPGLIAVAILTANNLRDYWTDKKVNKKTLVVRFGLLFGKSEYTACLLLAIFFPVFNLILLKKAAILAVFITFLIIRPLKKVWKAQSAQDFMSVLPDTAQILVGYAFLFSVGIFL